MVRVAIVDDEPEVNEKIKLYVQQYAEKHRIDISTECFQDGTDLIRGYRLQYDVIFLDIEMPRMNGMEVAENIRSKDSNVVIVFITNMAQYAINGYSVGALDFILKPVNYDSFSLRMERILARVHKRKSAKIMLQLPDGAVQLDTSQIYYVDIQNRMLHYHTQLGEFVLRGTLQSAERILKDHSFVRGNYWYLVNLRYVSEVRRNSLIVAGVELEISRRSKNALMAALTNFIEGGG